MTSQEIASLCGVSKTTVSRVINNDPKVKAETRDKILAAMKEYNYVPVASARQLAGIDSRIIGLFILDIDISDSTSRVSKSTYFSTLTTLIIDKANSSGFQVLVSIVTSDQQLEEAKSLFISGTIFSGICIGAFNHAAEVKGFMDLAYPMIVVDMQHDDKGASDKNLFINMDNFTGGYEATKHLIQLGHKCIGHITGDLRKLSGIERLKGYKKALSDFGIKYDDKLVWQGDFQEARAYKLANKIIGESKVTAVFSGNDVMAVGAIKGIRDMGYRVPKDYSIIGFDNIEIGNYTTPTLSTVYCRLEDIARHAVESLDYYNTHKRFNKAEILLKPELVQRESSIEIMVTN